MNVSTTLDARPHGPALFQGRRVVNKFDSADLHPASIHEASHRVMARLLGEVVESFGVHANGGYVALRRSMHDIIPRHAALLSIAGEVGERLFYGAGSSSQSDNYWLAQSLPKMAPAERESLVTEAERLLLAHRDEVLATARQLTAEGTITPSNPKLGQRPITGRVAIKARAGLGV